jgi:hypothetical protein
MIGRSDRSPGAYRVISWENEETPTLAWTGVSGRPNNMGIAIAGLAARSQWYGLIL